MYNKMRLKKRPYPPVAKLDIAVDSDSKGRGFESLRAGQSKKVDIFEKIEDVDFFINKKTFGNST